MPKQRTEVEDRVAVWTTGGFGQQVIALVLLLSLCSCFLGFAIVGSTKTRKPSVHPRAEIVIFKDSNGTITADPDKDADTSSVGLVAYFVYTRERGWPVAYAVGESHHLAFSEYDPKLTPVQLRAALGNHLALHTGDQTNSTLADLAAYSSRIAAGDFSTTRYLPEGIVIDALAHCAALAAVAGLILYMRHIYRVCLRRARSAVGLCPRCGYDMIDRNGQQCPECGESAPTPG